MAHKTVKEKVKTTFDTLKGDFKYKNKNMIKKGQKVKILIGDDKNKTGNVLKVFVKEQKVLVEGVNMKKKHIKPKSSDKKGEIIEVATPIHISNVKPVN